MSLFYIRGDWIPACAGMTAGEAGMTVMRKAVMTAEKKAASRGNKKKYFIFLKLSENH